MISTKRFSSRTSNQTFMSLTFYFLKSLEEFIKGIFIRIIKLKASN